jgi:hypothetical protein
MTDESNYRVVEVRDENGRLIGHQHQSEATPAVFLRPSTPRQTDCDEWGLSPTQQPKGPGYRGPGMQDVDAKPGPVAGPNISTAERGAAVRSLAFSNERIPAVDLANAMADPDLGQIVVDKVVIDLARQLEPLVEANAALTAWERRHSDCVGTVDLSRAGVPAIDLATEVAALRFLLSDDDEPWEKAIELSNGASSGPVIIDL